MFQTMNSLVVRYCYPACAVMSGCSALAAAFMSYITKTKRLNRWHCREILGEQITGDTVELPIGITGGHKTLIRGHDNGGGLI